MQPSPTLTYINSIQFTQTRKKTYKIIFNTMNSFDLNIPTDLIKQEFRTDVPILITTQNDRIKGIVLKTDEKTVYFKEIYVKDQDKKKYLKDKKKENKNKRKSKNEIIKMYEVRIENNEKRIKLKERAIKFLNDSAVQHDFLDEIFKERIRNKIKEENANEFDSEEFKESNKINSEEIGVTDNLENLNINLTNTQNKCLSLVKNQKNLKIIGPPGTGKTYTLVSIIKYIYSINKSLLVCANSNAALDNLAIHFVNFNFSKKGSKTKSKLKFTSKSNKYVFATLFQSLKINRIFDYVIIDEAYCTDEFELLSVLCKGRNVILAGDPYQLALESFKDRNKLIINKDLNESDESSYENTTEEELSNEINNLSNEINKVIESNNSKEIINDNEIKNNCKRILNEKESINDKNIKNINTEFINDELTKEELEFVNDNDKLVTNKIVNECINDSKESVNNKVTKESKEIKHLFEEVKINEIILDKSFRSSNQMIDWSNKTFYKGIIQSDIQPSSFDNKEILFVDTYNETYESNKISKKNELEAEMVVNLQNKFGGVIISMYKAQTELLLTMTNDVYTVDSFQGKESDTVILSLVRTEKLGFLNNLKRINVAVTRARKRLIIIGDGKMLLTSELREFIQYLHKNAFVVDYYSAINDDSIF